MISPQVIIPPIVSYLIGAIPFGLIYSLYIAGEDIREKGSGNIGATNIRRYFGWLPGLATLFLDMSKGALPVAAVLYIFETTPLLAVVTGGAAIIGHVYPVYLKFSGGKGVATSAGVFLILAPFPLLATIVLFLLVVIVSRYVSVGSISAAVALPVACAFYYSPREPVSVAALALGIVVIWRHRSNIKNLWHGEEGKFY